MQVVVATHGHCFDGLVSAVLFTRLLRALEGSRTEFAYRACGYGYAQPKPDESVLTGDQNAILDFRLTPSKRVSWLFDHHRTAFQLPGAEALFDAHRNQGRMYVDADYASCAKLIADVSRERFGVHDPNLDELVEWADRVDAARFESPQDAIDQQDPIKRLVSVVEHCADDRFVARQVPELLSKPLLEVATSREIRKRYRPLGRRQRRIVELLRARCERRGRVVFADLTDANLDSSGKFVTYALHPRSVYSVLVGRQGKGAKVLVGYNPWCQLPRDLDLSSLCARYGGGGHAHVGAIPFGTEDLETARLAAEQIVGELAG